MFRAIPLENGEGEGIFQEKKNSPHSFNGIALYEN